MPEKDVLVITPRPQISVHISEHGDVVITVSSMSDDMQRVEINDVTFPRECASEVGNALLGLAAQN